MTRLLLIVALIAFSAGCSKDDKPSTSAPVPTVAPVYGFAPVSTTETAPSTLDAIEVGRHDGFVRVVLQFREQVPGYAVQLDGKNLSVRCNANAHDEAGAVTVPRHTDGAGVVTGVDITEDFEGVVNLTVATTTRLPYKVFTLTNPSRLVVDIKS